MSRYFSVTASAVDTDANVSSSTARVRAVEPASGAPNVHFNFPDYVSVATGDGVDPIWTSGTCRGFAFVEVLPTDDDPTTRFLVQCYRDAADWPNAPARRFGDTFANATAMLASDWALGSSAAYVVGGGIPGSGFCSKDDPYGRRPALVATNVHNLYAEPGCRVSQSDTVFTAYDHDAQTSCLRSVAVGRTGVPPRANGLPVWPANTLVVAHPYWYVPSYGNDGNDVSGVSPVVAVIREGDGTPLRGSFVVQGTSVSGTLSKISDEAAAGMAVRFGGVSPWYVVRSVSGDAAMTIYDYGDAPAYSGVVAEVAPMASGTQTIHVLPNMTGCNLWGISLSPRPQDGEVIALPTVTYSAVKTGDGPTSGILVYDWTIVTEDPTTKALTSSGVKGTTASTIQVAYQTGTRRNVIVACSGIGQPACVHTDQTGLIGLQVGTSAGTWIGSNVPSGVKYADADLDPKGVLPYGNVVDYCGWKQTLAGNAVGGTTIHHYYEYLQPKGGSVTGGLAFGSTVKIASGTLADWPSRGTFVARWTGTIWDQWFTGKAYFAWGTYDGITSSWTGDLLNNVHWTKNSSRNSRGIWNEMANGAPGSSWPSFGEITVSLQTLGQMPATHIVGRNGQRGFIVENPLAVAAAGMMGVKGSTGTDGLGVKQAWIFPAGTNSGIQRVSLTGWDPTTGELTVNEAVDPALASGQMVVAPWFHARNDQTGFGYNDQSRGGDWNYCNLSLLAVIGVTGSSKDEALAGPTSFALPSGGAWSLWLYNPMTGVLPGAAGTGIDANDYGKYVHLWVPPVGKVLIPRVDRKNVVVAYSGVQVQMDGADSYVQLQGCVVTRPETTCPDASPTVGKWNVAYLHQELRNPGTWSVSSDSASAASFQFVSPVLNPTVVGMAGKWVDRIYASTSQSATWGDAAFAASRPLWEEIVPNWPTDGIPQLDPMHCAKAKK
jgi:hypothetical protein